MADGNTGKTDGNFVVVWLDKNNETRENMDTKELISLNVRSQLKTFDNPDYCVDFILTEHTKKIFLIISNSFGSYVVPMIYQIPQLHTIYVYCAIQQHAEVWAKPSLKISGIFTNKKMLIDKIRDDLRACDKDSHLPISIFHLEDKEKSLRKLTENSATFMWYQLLILVLQRLARSSEAKNEMIKECRLRYESDPTEQEKINKFQQEYAPTKAIWWYTYDCFVYRLLNQALRTQHIDIIFRFRFFINDLNNQIKYLYLEYLKNHQPISKHHLTVYRGQHLSIEELNSLKNNVNGLISMNTFLSATLNKNLALIFAETATPCTETSIQSVLFTINVIDMSKETTPFAPIKSYSCYEEEDEVLFTLGAIFKVESVTKEDNLWNICLQLSKEQNNLYHDLSKNIMKQIGTDISPLILGWFLYRMNDFSKAERYAESLLKQLPDRSRETGNTYNLLGLICKDTGRLAQAIEYYEKALENHARTSTPDSPLVLGVHYNLALAYLAQGDKKRAAEHQKYASDTLTNSQSNNPLLIAMTDSLKANIELANGNYANAFKNLEVALKRKKATLPKGHASLATTLKDMGIVQVKMLNDESALDYFQQALEIYQKGLAANHLDLAECHANIARVHYRRQEYKLALERFEIALNIIKENTREDIESVDILEKCITETEQAISAKNE